MTTAPNLDPKEMATAYDAAAVEQPLYEWWERSGFFKPANPGAPSFTVIMPPPNLTGELHMGHALTNTVEDALVRWHRMLGDDTLWLPGVDHAAIAVNAIIERDLAREGISRHDIGRDEFLNRTWEFVRRSRDRISTQHRRLGASADWSREAFTMDEQREKSVRTTFKNLYTDGLIYRAERLINWCVDCGSAISDIEVEYEDEPGSFWHVRYALAEVDGTPLGRDIVIATTRPETIPADTAIAVHPEDPRYADLIGKRAIIPTNGRLVPIIGDTAVSMESGSGALKVTPGHDPVDFEIGERHGLEIISIINPDGTLNALSGDYDGMDRFDARKRLVADLETAGRIEKIEPYTHAIGHCQRSRTIVEPLISMQWWVDAKTLAKPAIEAVTDGRIKFVPERFERTYLQWMENIRDWCISRQIWWGHRIPVWFCDQCDHLTVAIETPTRCEACNSEAIRQDEDTLDTWFSSGLWPHSTLGWPDDTDDLKRFYPTQVMETGYDIIFFWVARMVMLSLYNMNGVVPFETVYLHGLVRAPDGAKMSKSRGNVVDPLEVIAKVGTDGLRYALVSGTSPGNDQRITDDRLEAGRNFSNKLWNASRFVLQMVEPSDDLALPAPGTGALEDRWILSRLATVTEDSTRLMERFELSEALRQVRDFFWDEFADWYIEVAKVRVRADDRTPLPVLVNVLDAVLRLLHPIMPYVTEEIWQRLNTLAPDVGGAPALIVARYPVAEGARHDAEAERQFGAVQDFIRGIRNVRAEKRVDAGRWVEAYIVAADVAPAAQALQEAIENLARVRPLHIVADASAAPTEGVVTAVLDLGQVVLPMAGLFDQAAERDRLSKQIAEVEAEVGRQEAKLSNEAFTAKAPEAVVAKERERLDTARTRLDGLRASLAEIG
ncbi:MAG: valine--tRNA ligase [Chloroflexi bacterium]|nr:valine--tRNA ligase [Chloroflexota bacterium]MDA1240589.1 valine--tRNA ligase [Chloroflexota bacterium]MQC18950.1 valine--tRNA ligase [Chloroflexota bacterium]